MPETRRRHADREQFWRDAIAAWKASGQSVRAFCAARGIGEATFFARRRQLADRNRSQRPAARPTPNPAFAAVRVVPEPTVEVVLPTGLVVRAPLGADPASVARMVAAPEADPADLLPDVWNRSRAGATSVAG